MFSSFVSFLPSLHLPNSTSSNNLAQSPVANQFEPTDTPEEEEAYKQQQPPTEDETGVKKGKTKTVNETFIIVRPPPAKSNHPLNLQVQLVPPAARNTRQSLDESDGGNSTATSQLSLTRTASNRSDTSTYSSYGSTASFSSTASATSTRRTIVPLYSLQAHNVLTNTIVDAGTDAKIAKFLKRGIELVDLAILEPVEVWSEPPKSVPAIRTSRPATPDFSAHSMTTAESSVTSLPHTSSNLNPNATTPNMTPIPLPPSTPTGLSGNGSSSKRNLFGKMFKKKDNSITSPPSSPAPSRSSPLNSPLQSTKPLIPDPSTTPTPGSSRVHTRNLSSSLSPAVLTDKLRHRSSSPNPRVLGLGLLQVPSLEDSPSHQGNGNGVGHRSSMDVTTPTTSNPSAEDKILRPPVLGIQPTLSYSYSPAGGVAPEPVSVGSLGKSARALMYVWFVRKWFKRRADDTDAGGLLGMVQSHTGHTCPASGRGSGFSLNGSGHTAAGEGVEVRFEWKRNSAKGRARKGRGRRGRKDGGEEAGRSDKGKSSKDRLRERVGDKLTHRLSINSHQSVSTNLSTSEDGQRDRSATRDVDNERRGSFNMNREDDDGDESDPEDSETPWTCTLKIRRTGPGTTGSTFTARSRQPSTQGGGDEVGVLPQTPQVLRFKVGTLSPTPHHPKVIAMLKVPFPLPDVEVERMAAVKRGTAAVNTQQWEGLTLTAEEIKDVVCSTAMWLAVREGFGGVGKVNRKGDGWRIRA
ncbi:hypothetical protein DXG01_011089 [Tephrocybe rancida]|nr:hypothetical protein DXG01_011089 [Tephrocybe rancida]